MLARLEAGRSAERLGARERAVDAYHFVLDIWRHGDRELEPYRHEAQQGLARLTAEARP